MKIFTHGILFLLGFFILTTTQAQKPLTLWYNHPTEKFEESMVMGNGKMGASIFGGIPTDTIVLNDITLWNGEPTDPSKYKEVYKNLPAVREALNNDSFKLADKLNKKIQGPYSNAYAPLGNLLISVKHAHEATKYTRALNIGNAISTIQYQVAGVVFTREYFVSYPDQIMAIKLTANKKGALNFNLQFKSPQKNTVSVNGALLNAKGYAPGRKNLIGTSFTSLFSINKTDGTIIHTDSSMGVNNATEAIVYVSIATSFNGYNKNPVTEGVDDQMLAKKNLIKAATKSFQQIKIAHQKDYQTYFNRVHLNLGVSTAPDLPTDERLKRYSEGKEDHLLEALYFQFGRYLLISCSRTKAVPANLQGLWNPFLNPPWASNYTMNINTQENYWLAENTNLSEMHMPLLTFIENLSKTGAISAKYYYGVNGWSASHNSDIWAMTNPVGDGSGSPQWANWNMAGTWLVSHLWEHYAYTKDKIFLQQKAYPLMQGAARFCLEYLVEDKNGYLVPSPSVSPENKYLAPDGYKGYTLIGATGDVSMIRECFINTIKASEILKIDTAFRAQLVKALAKLYPYQIGKKGNIQEWYNDWEDGEFQHQAQSHLFGLFPGHLISVEKTPKEAAASKLSLELRGDLTTGWSKAWRMNLWARLYDGEHAYKFFRSLLKYVKPTVLKANYKSGGTYASLLDAHPPFQIDGNFGGTAAIVEMLMQSSETEIRLLPALPEAWSSGSVSGICARGGFEINMQWENKQLIGLEIFSKLGGGTTIYYGSKNKKILLKKGEHQKVYLN